MPFEVFSSDVARRDSPSVTISPLGRFSFNKAATAFFENERLEYVLLMWDREHKIVGIRQSSDSDTRSFRVHYGKKGNGAAIAAMPFLKFIGYDYAVSRSFAVHWIRENREFTFALTESSVGKPS